MRQWRTWEQDAWHPFAIETMAMIPLSFLPGSSRAFDTRALGGELPMRFLTISHGRPQIYGHIYPKVAELPFV